MSHDDPPANPGLPSHAEQPADDGEFGPREQWHHAVVALGSNLGDREETLFQALADLRATEGVRVLAESSLHETVALTASGYDEEAPGYVNQVVAVQTAWQPEALLDILLDIEARHGRTRDGTLFANRTLDLDLISYDNVQSQSPRLTLPHPRAHEREFVLGPWSEIDPEATLPGRGPVSALIAQLGDQAGATAETSNTNTSTNTNAQEQA
jgi:2-amino-4-hydroxy-6-hydroxymethyldihydropteridine diphosphokinase